MNEVNEVVVEKYKSLGTGLGDVMVMMLERHPEHTEEYILDWVLGERMELDLDVYLKKVHSMTGDKDLDGDGRTMVVMELTNESDMFYNPMTGRYDDVGHKHSEYTVGWCHDDLTNSVDFDETTLSLERCNELVKKWCSIEYKVKKKKEYNQVQVNWGRLTQQECDVLNQHLDGLMN